VDNNRRWTQAWLVPAGINVPTLFALRRYALPRAPRVASALGGLGTRRLTSRRRLDRLLRAPSVVVQNHRFHRASSAGTLQLVQSRPTPPHHPRGLRGDGARNSSGGGTSVPAAPRLRLRVKRGCGTSVQRTHRTPHPDSPPTVGCLAVESRHGQSQNFFLIGPRGELAHQLALPHDEDPVAEQQHLGQFRGDQQNGHPLGG
jgi:hypothetical protein